MVLVLEFYKKSQENKANVNVSIIAPRAFAMVAVLAVIILGMGCLSGPSGASDGLNSATVRGAIIGVESLSLLELDVLEIRDEAGRAWTFMGQGKIFPLFTPSHLTEHQVLGLSVQVSYHREGDALIIDDISD